MEKQKGMGTVAALVIVGFWLTAVVGWAINLVEVIKLAAGDAPITTLFAVKAVGIVFVPIGAICGLFF